MRKSRFQCCTGQFCSNQVVIMVKRIRNISFKIVETFVLIPLIELRNETLVIRIKSGILNFCGIRKSRFQCCTGQFCSNQVFIMIKRIRNISFKIVQTFVLIPLIELRMGDFSNSNKVSNSQFLRNTQITFPMLFSTVLVKWARYCAQTNQEYFL